MGLRRWSSFEGQLLLNGVSEMRLNWRDAPKAPWVATVGEAAHAVGGWAGLRGAGSGWGMSLEMSLHLIVFRVIWLPYRAQDVRPCGSLRLHVR